MKVSFYYVNTDNVAKIIAQLAHKVYCAGIRSIILAKDEEQLINLDNTLWSFRQNVFLPHGTKNDGNPDNQPIWLTTVIEQPNNAKLLIANKPYDPAHTKSFIQILDIFNAKSIEQLESARNRWKYFKQNNFEIKCWQQNENDSWIEKN